MGYLFYYNRLSGTEKRVYQQIYDGLCSYSDKIRTNKISEGKIFDIYNDVLNDHPELSVADPLEIPTMSSLFEFCLVPGYFFPQETIYEYHMKFLEECAFIANRITYPGASDIEKEIAIHDFLCRNIRYGYCDANSERMREKLSQSAFSTLFERTGVCRGISRLFKCLADLVGLNSFIIEGDICEDGEWSPHAWNAVQIEGRYVFVDITSDICAYDSVKLINYLRFNFSSQDAMEYKWDTAKYPICNAAVAGFYDYKKLIVNDEAQLIRVLKNGVINRNSVFHFQVKKGSILSLKSENEIMDMVVNHLCMLKEQDVSVKYIFDPVSGRCVVGV